MGQYARIKRGRSAASGEAASASAVCRARLHVPPRRALWGSGLLRQLFDAEHAAQHKAHEPVCVKYDNLHAYGHSPFCRARRRLPRLHVFAQRRAHTLSARPCADQQRTIMTPSATMMTAATNNVNPEGLMLARIMPRPKAAAHTARWRRSARQPCRQNFGLRKTGTSVSRKLAPKGYSSIYGSAEMCYTERRRALSVRFLWFWRLRFGV